MRISLLATFPVFALSFFLGADRADAASCSYFGKIAAYDAAGKTAELAFEKSNMRRFFPQPEGATNSDSKVPKRCASKVRKGNPFPVAPTGGRMSVTQVRANFSGKMLNDTDDPAWLPAKLQELIDSKTQVLLVLRPPVGKKKPVGLTTIYLPITDEERAEIERINNQAEEVD